MSLSALGIFSAAGAGGVGDYELIESTILTGSQASVTFSGLGAYSSTYKHLQIRATVRTSRSDSGEDGLLIRLNGNTGANYASHQFFGSGTSVTSSNAVSGTFMRGGQINGNTAVANAFSASIIDLTDAYTTKNKTIKTRNGSAVITNARWVRLSSGVFINTDSLTTVLLYPEIGANFLTGSRFSLYGIRG
jgi:hypothetical protein